MQTAIKFNQITNNVYGITRFTVLAMDLIQDEEKHINTGKCVLWSELLPLAHAKGRLLGGSVWRGDKDGAFIVFEAPAGLEPLQAKIAAKLADSKKIIGEAQNLCFDISCDGREYVPQNPTTGDAIAWGMSVVRGFKGARKYGSYVRMLAAYMRARFAINFNRNT